MAARDRTTEGGAGREERKGGEGAKLPSGATDYSSCRCH